jgi:putative hydrolase of the HAD superfamily
MSFGFHKVICSGASRPPAAVPELWTLGETPMVTLRAVIFDFFGTLVPNFTLSAHKNALREMASALGAPFEQFEEHWLATFTQRATGVFPTVRSNIEAVCSVLDVAPEERQYDAAIRIRYAFERRSVLPRHSALPVLQALRALGLRTGLISDCSAELPEIWQETPFATLFDSTIFSTHVKVRKPNPEIYFASCRSLGVVPAQCLYVGDGGSQELTGARAVGMRPVLLSVREEQGNADTHRIDGEEWTGPRIAELNELLVIVRNEPNHSPPATAMKGS